MIEGQCPVCRRVFKVDDRYAGMTGRCKACGAPIRVPGEPDEGLDGLPPVEPAPDAPAPNLPAPAAPPAPSPVAPTGPQTPPDDPAPAPPPTDRPLAEPRLGEPNTPHPADDLSRHHDTRDRYEPSHGPTPTEGPWLRHERERLAAQPAPLGPEPAETPPPTAERVLASRFVTPPEAEPHAVEHRPALIVVACIVLALLGIGFALHFATAGATGRIAGGIGLALAALAIARLWTARWDGLVAGLLFCLCVAGGALQPSEVALARPILLAASAVALFILLLAVLRRSGRDYFTT